MHVLATVLEYSIVSELDQIMSSTLGLSLLGFRHTEDLANDFQDPVLLLNSESRIDIFNHGLQLTATVRPLVDQDQVLCFREGDFRRQCLDQGGEVRLVGFVVWVVRKGSRWVGQMCFVLL